MESFPNLLWNPYEDDEEEKQNIKNMLASQKNQDTTSGDLPVEYKENYVDKDPESTFGDLWQAQIGYQYDPILESAYRWWKYSESEHQEGFEPLGNMEGYEGMEASLIVARNEDESYDIKRAIDENRERRETMSEWGFGANLVAGILDPINLVAIPFAGAGFVTAAARSAGGFIARRAVATGAGVGLTQVVLEGARYPFDPVGDFNESLRNIGLATVAGAFIGGAISIPPARRLTAESKTIAKNEELQTAHENLIVNDLDRIDAGDGVAKSQRQFGDESTETLQAGVDLLPTTIEKIKKRIADNKVKIQSTPDGKRLYDNYEEHGRVTQHDLDALTPETKKLILGERSGDPDFYFHGTNEKTTFVDGRHEVTDAPIRGTRTLDRYIDKQGNLVLKQTPDDIRGANLNGVSLTDNFDNALTYTASKDKFGTNKRDPNSVGGDDSIIFKIKTSALEKNSDNTLKDGVSEAMGETLVQKDLIIKKGDYEVIRFGKNGAKKSDSNSIPELGIVNLFKSLKKHTEQLDEMTTEQNLRKLEESRNQPTIKDKYRLIDSWLTKNKFYTKALATPLKNILQGKYPDLMKKYMLTLSADSGLGSMFQKMGESLGNSVYQMAAMRNGEWVSVIDKTMKLYGKATNQGTKKIMDIVGGPKGYQEWIINVNKAYINKNKKGLTNAEKEAYEIFETFWTTWRGRLEETGLIGSVKYFKQKTLLNELDIRDVKDFMGKLEHSYGSRFQEFADQVGKITDVIQKLQREAGEGGLNSAQRKALKEANAYLDKFAEPRFNPFKSPKQFNAYKGSMAKLKRLEKQNKEYAEQILEPTMAKNEDNMFSRFWDREAIDANRPKLEKILYDWYAQNPMVRVYDETQGKYIEKKLSIIPADLAERAKTTVDSIIGKKDVTGEDQVFYGMGRSKHFKHRGIDIPNKLVFDFIINDPQAVMKAYTTRVAPRYEFAKQFNGKTLDDVLDDFDIEMGKANYSKAEIDKGRMNFQHMYDRIVGSVMRKDPQAWDMMAVKVMRDAAQLNYLGSAGFSTLPDLAKILMEHDMSTLRKLLEDAYHGDKRLALNVNEGRLAGEILDIITGASHLRMTEELANNPFSNGFYDKWSAKGKNAFYIANLLAPATRIFKQIDSMARVHTLIDLAVRKHVGNNYKAGKEGDTSIRELSQFDVTYAARYNITDTVAKDINELLENGTIERTNNGLYIANTENWPTHMHVTRDEFRASLNSGILNTIMMGTPADKPIIVDGVFYIPMRVASKLGLDEDNIVRGYHRIESPLLGLPFQFMSYSFAAMNKITAGLATDQVRNRSVAIASSMGLAYMSLSIKSELGGKGGEAYWDNMAWEDRLARSFDASGVGALLSDIMYQSMAVSSALDGPDLGFGILKEKGKPSKGFDPMGAITTVGGAGTSITHDFFRKGLAEFVTGNQGEGAKHMLRNFPAMRLWFLKGIVNDMSSEWGRTRGRTERTGMGGRF